MTNDQHTCNVLTKEWEKKLVAEEIQIFLRKIWNVDKFLLATSYVASA